LAHSTVSVVSGQFTQYHLAPLVKALVVVAVLVTIIVTKVLITATLLRKRCKDTSHRSVVLCIIARFDDESRTYDDIIFTDAP